MECVAPDLAAPTPPMDTTTTSPAIIALILGATAAVGYAWWLSIAAERRFATLVTWLRRHHGATWSALPWFARTVNTIGGVELLRRGHLGNDAAFMTRYRDAKSVRGQQLALLVTGMILIGLVPLGLRFLGWSW